MDNFFSLITDRRSTRKFTGKPLTNNQFAMILKAALMAPTSKNAHSWQFVVVEDKNTLRQLAGCKKYGASFLEGCALAIVVLGETSRTDVWIEDASIAASYMQLQAEDLGIGSCWCQVRNRLTEDGQDSEQYIRELLDAPQQFGVLSIIGFGQIDQERKPVDESDLLWEKVYIEKFGMQDIPLQDLQA